MSKPHTPTPTVPRPSVFCSPIDAVFIFLSSIFLLIVFLSLSGRQVIDALPPVIVKAVSNVWSSVIVGGGAAGIFALRKWMYQREGPNYVVWILGCTVFWLALLIVTTRFLSNPVPTPRFITATAHFSLPTLSAEKSKVEGIDVNFKQVAPHFDDDVILLSPRPEENGGYRRTPLQIPISGSGNFVADLHHIVLDGHASNSIHEWEYRICLEDQGQAVKSAPPEVWLNCDSDGSCAQDAGHTSTISTCTGEKTSLIHLPVVHAADEIREPGWDIPSLSTLKKQLPEHRGGYTEFTVAFQPTSLLSKAQRFYYSVRVNDTPTFVDGFLPQRTTFPLAQGSTNTLSFGLENLNFRGQHDGYEEIAVTLFFIDKDGRVVHQIVLATPYAALHEAASVAFRDSFASGSWHGTYMKPRVESRYNIDLEGSPRIDLINRDRKILDGLLPQQGPFVSSTGSLKGPIVTVVRPPWHSASYGLGLGVKLPTGQVQFTFNHQEAAEVCHWAAQNIHAIGMNHLRRMLYDSVTRNGPACD